MKYDLEKNKPYYAVIFTSNLSNDTTDYSTVAEKMEDLAKQQPGFLGVESARDNSGLGITISYWESLEAIENWKRNALHKEAKKEAVSNGMKISTCASALLRKNISFREKSCKGVSYATNITITHIHNNSLHFSISSHFYDG